MTRLARYHVPRPRLVELLEPASVGLIEAGGGYGKSSLAAEYAATLGATPVAVLFEPRDEAAEFFVSRLAGAARLVGLAAAADAIASPGLDPVDATDALADSLASFAEPVLLVLDDAHHCGGTAARLLQRLATRLPAPHRSLVLCRRLPAGASGFRRTPGVVVLDTRALALTPEEVGALLASGFGVELSDAATGMLARATGGWAAAVVLAAGRLARASDPDAEVAAIAEQPTVLAYLVQEHLAELPAGDRAAVVQLAHLPLLSSRVAEATGSSDLFERAAALGVPFTATRDGWFELPGPVQEYLAAIAPLEPGVARRAAQVYVERAEVVAALRVLLAAADGHSAAELLATLPPARVEALDFVEVRAVVDALPDEAIHEHPQALLRLARAAQWTDQSQLRADALRRAAAVAAERGDDRLAREVDAEVACDLVRDGAADQAEKLARQVLADCDGEELLVRARSLEVIGTALASRGDPGALAAAEPPFEEAARLCRQVGETAMASGLLALLGYYVVYPQGRHAEAIEWIDQALELAGARRRPRALALFTRGEVLVDCGRYPEAEAALAEARELAKPLRDHRLLAYALWETARLASQRGEATSTVELLREVEATRGQWFDTATGVEFLADAADLLDRVGEHGLALEYLDRARVRRAEGEHRLLLAEGAVAARSGDPALAEEWLGSALTTGRIDPREHWRVTLLRAFAALRRGDPASGALAAQAFEQAAALRLPSLPFVRERAVAERLVALAAEAGSHSAAALATGDLPLTVQALGRFEVASGGRAVAVPEGKPDQLVKLLAASRGRLHADEAIEALWPEVDPERGRKRLRNVLNRLRTGAGELVVRDGESLRLAANVEVDAIHFEDEASRAFATGLPAERIALARAALARYRGDLLPDDLYEPWAAGPRERLRGRCLALLDLLAGDAEARGDRAEALRLLERAIETDPYEQERYLRAARLLLEQGRRAAAARVLRRARAVLERLGLRAPPELLELAKQVRE